MNNKKFHEVKTGNYTSKFYKLDENLICFDRTHYHPIQETEFNSFGKFWTLGLGYFEDNLLSAKRKNKLIPIEGLKGIIIPPSSIVEWHNNPGHLKWCGYFPFADYPETLPSEASVFNWDGRLPRNSDQFFELLLSLSANQFTEISKEEECSAIAYKVRNYISKNCDNELPIKEVADHFGYSHSVMARQFKKCFGISPVKFRNTIRIFDTMINMIKENTTVIDAAYSSGFSDLSRFYRQFKKHINATPCQFRQMSK